MCTAKEGNSNSNSPLACDFTSDQVAILHLLVDFISRGLSKGSSLPPILTKAISDAPLEKSEERTGSDGKSRSIDDARKSDLVMADECGIVDKCMGQISGERSIMQQERILTSSLRSRRNAP